MSIEIDWIAFLQVFAVALVGTVLVVGLYSAGLRLLVAAGRPPVVAPAEFTDAITVISPKAAKRAAKAADASASKIAVPNDAAPQAGPPKAAKPIDSNAKDGERR